MINDWANLSKYDKENSQLLATPNLDRIVFLGDSITEFWKDYDSDFFTSATINRGISGQTTPQILLRFRSDVINLKPKAVIILAGINDVAENTGPISNQGIIENLMCMVELAKVNNIEPFVCSILPTNRFDWNHKILPANRVIELNKMIQLYAENNKTTYVDYYSEMVDSDKGLKKIYGDDGVHPNAEGYKIMKLIINKKIHSVIK